MTDETTTPPDIPVRALRADAADRCSRRAAPAAAGRRPGGPQNPPAAPLESVLIQASRSYAPIVTEIERQGGTVTQQYTYFDGLAAQVPRSATVAIAARTSSSMHPLHLTWGWRGSEARRRPATNGPSRLIPPPRSIGLLPVDNGHGSRHLNNREGLPCVERFSPPVSGRHPS